MKKLHSVCPVCNPMFRLAPDMIRVLYTEEPGGTILYYETYDNQFDRKRAYEYLLDKGFEIVGED